MLKILENCFNWNILVKHHIFTPPRGLPAWGPPDCIISKNELKFTAHPNFSEVLEMSKMQMLWPVLTKKNVGKNKKYSFLWHLLQAIWNNQLFHIYVLSAHPITTAKFSLSDGCHHFNNKVGWKPIIFKKLIVSNGFQ